MVLARGEYTVSTLFDGENLYRAYADSADGSLRFSETDSDRLYLGTYVGRTKPTKPSQYKWTLVRGPQGIPGKNGTDGTTTYTWIRYADTPTSGMSNSPIDKKYIGLSFNQTTQTESSNYNDYQWSLMPQNIEIGGRNLQRDITKEYMESINKITIVDDRSLLVEYQINSASSPYVFIRKTETLHKGQEYTLSFYATLYRDKNVQLMFGLRYDGGFPDRGQTLEPEVRTKITHTFKPTKDGSPILILFTGITDIPQSILIEDMKLEKGNTATDWTPAPEDIQSDLDDTKEQVKKTVKTITEEYYQSTSSTSQTGGSWTTTAPKWDANKFMFVRSKITYVDGTTSYTPEINLSGAKGDKGDTGKDGVAGKDGVGIQKTEIHYASSTSGTTKPSTGWSLTVPTTSPGNYLWTRTTWTYTDGDVEEGYSVSRIGKDGNTGSDGVAGKDGVGIKSTVINYATSTSGTTKPTSGWTTTIPSVAPGNYLWTRTVWTYTDNDVETGYSVSRIGEKGDTGPRGPQGPQGIQGPSGSNGQSQWVHIRYSPNSTGSGMTTNPSSTTKYVGIAVTNSATAPAYTGFTWSKYVGEDGSRGPQGLPGQKGDDGTTSYTWIRYADTPTSGMNQYPDGKKYIGMAFNKTTQTESSNYSDYKWSLMPQNIEIGAKTQDELENISHIYFDGNGYIEFPDEAKNLVHGGTEATIEFWNKQDSLAYGLLQLSGFADTNGNLYPYQDYTTAYLDVFRTNRLGPITMKKPVNRWHHFAVTTHPTEGWKLYQDGVLVYTTSAQSTVDVSYLKFRVGQNSGSRYSNAGYRDIRLWNKARTHQEIITNMNQDVTENENGLVGYWKVNEGSGNTVADLVNGNDGVIVNGSWRGIQNQIDDKANNSDLTSTIQTITEESEKIASLRTDVDITKNNFLITHTDEYVNKITTTESSLDGLDKRVVNVEETKENIDTFFQFDDAFTIGKSNAQTKLRMTNDEIQFLDGETKGTYITGNTMVSQNIQIQDKFNLPKHTMETEGDITVVRFTG